MRYKIGDVARILGISADLLRYYEKKGVVTPYKDVHNDYRYYDSWDINFLMDCLWFKNFGFSIEQIADMVRIPSTSDLEDIFLYKEDELRSTIARCQLQLRRSEEYRAQLEAIPSHLGVCELADSPALVRFINRVGNEYPTGEGLDQFARQWLRAMPFNHRYFEISQAALQGGDEMDFRWGFSLEPYYVEQLDFPVEPPFESIPSTRSIHTFFQSRGKNNFTARHLDYALDWAREQNLVITGPAQGMLVASVLEDDELGGYFECWIPVEEASGQEEQS
jgi:DNA-binding transcriptional MerR regulator